MYSICYILNNATLLNYANVSFCLYIWSNLQVGCRPQPAVIRTDSWLFAHGWVLARLGGYLYSNPALVLFPQGWSLTPVRKNHSWCMGQVYTCWKISTRDCSKNKKWEKKLAIQTSPPRNCQSCLPFQVSHFDYKSREDFFSVEFLWYSVWPFVNWKGAIFLIEKCLVLENIQLHGCWVWRFKWVFSRVTFPAVYWCYDLMVIHKIEQKIKPGLCVIFCSKWWLYVFSHLVEEKWKTGTGDNKAGRVPTWHMDDLSSALSITHSPQVIYSL